MSHTLGFKLWIEVRDSHIAELIESLSDVSYVYIMPRTVNNVAIVLIFTGTVHTADSLNGIDVADFLIEEKRMQLRLVESCL